MSSIYIGGDALQFYINSNDKFPIQSNTNCYFPQAAPADSHPAARLINIAQELGNLHLTSASNPADTTTVSKRLEQVILSLYRCSRCSSLCLPEQYECPRGHVVCEECWLGLTGCGHCADGAGFRRSASLERLADELLAFFPCREVRCPELLRARAWREHVASCQG